MTAHFIEMPLNESSSVSQASVSLTCRRFYGSHTYDTIAAMISQIHRQYDLNIEKISELSPTMRQILEKHLENFLKSQLKVLQQLV